MATGKQSISGISSRRSACDRCRLIKARCPRQHPEQAQCDRCSRASADCVTSPIFRLRKWHPPDTINNSISESGGGNRPSKRRRHRHAGHQQQLPTPSDSGVVQGSSTAHNVESYQEQTSSPVPHLAHFLYEEGGHERLDTPSGPVENAFDMNLSEGFFETMAPVSTGANLEASSPLLYSSSTDLTGEVTTHNCETPPPMTVNGFALRSNDKTPVDSDQTPMQQLSRVDYELITILSRVDHIPPDVVACMVVGQKATSSPSVVDEIFNETTKYIDVLKLLGEYCPPTASNPTQEAYRGSKLGFQDGLRSGYSSDSSEYDSNRSMMTDDTDSLSQSTYSISSLTSHPELDTPAVLLVLTVYMRLLRLHLIIFTHIYEFLKEVSECENPQLQQVTSLNFGNLPLRTVEVL